MNIAVVGTGYVGLVSGVCFADFGFNVTCVDTNKEKIDILNSGGVPIYEPGLSTLIKKNVDAHRLLFSTSLHESVENADIIFIAVGTPSREDGSANLDYVFSAANNIAESIKENAVLVVKSTVPVGTTAKVKKILEKNGKNNSVAFNPEFLKEGAAIDDFMHPDRVILGVESEHAKKMLSHVYRPLYVFNTPIAFMNLESAELCKYASNAFLAMKVSFINQVADLCEKCNADVNDVALAMGLDTRIGSKFLQAGPGFGGSCFPKDTSALSDFAKKDYGINMSLVDETISYNNKRKINMVDRIVDACNGSVNGKKVAILGVTFKPNTDDIRDAPSLDIIPRLQKLGAKINAFDPSNSTEAKKCIENVEWGKDIYSASNQADAVVILTDWNDFRSINLNKLSDKMNGNVLVDLRNLYSPSEAREAGLQYYSVGRR